MMRGFPTLDKFAFSPSCRPDELALLRIYLLSLMELRCVGPITQRNLREVPKPPSGHRPELWHGTTDVGVLPVLYVEQVLQNVRFRATPGVPEDAAGMCVSLDVCYEGLAPVPLHHEIPDARDVRLVSPSSSPAKFVFTEDLVVHGGTCVVEVAHTGIPIALVSPGEEIHLDCPLRLVEVYNAAIVPRVDPHTRTLTLEGDGTRLPHEYVLDALRLLNLDIRVLLLRLAILGGGGGGGGADEELVRRGQDRFMVSFSDNEDSSVFEEVMLVRGRGSLKLVGSLFARVMRGLPEVVFAASRTTTFPDTSYAETAEIAVRVAPGSGRTALSAAEATARIMLDTFDRMREEFVRILCL